MNIQTANRLVALRKERGFSQEELAAKIGVSRQAVSKWERAEASPDTDNLILLARLYQVSLDELLAISDIPASSPPPPEALAEDEADAASEPPEPRPFEAPAPSAEPNGGWDGASPPQRNYLKLTRFPYPVLAVLIYLILGFSYRWWHPGWLIFFTIPFYYWFAAAVDRSRQG
jgi:transcriptional regulator with XRE-family HTH domain